jgi:hypothetical protein
MSHGDIEEGIPESFECDGAEDNLGAAWHSRSSSSRANQEAGKKRFERFLVWMLKTKKAKDRDEISLKLFNRRCNDLPEADIVWGNININEIGIMEMNRFANWLFFQGTHLRDSSKEIAYKTADSDLSAVSGLIRGSSFYSDANRLSPEKMKSVRRGMLNLFNRRAIQQNRPLIQSHKTALQSDLLRIVMICLWSNCARLAQCAFFLISLCQLAGRATETAVMLFRRITMQQPEEFSDAGPEVDKIPIFTLWRTKTRTEQSLSVFNHRDFFFLSVPFLMFVSMTMNLEPDDSLFPIYLSKTVRKKASQRGHNSADELVKEQEKAEKEEVDEMRQVEEADGPVEDDPEVGLDHQGVEDDPEVGLDHQGVAKYVRETLESIRKAAERLDSFLEAQREEAPDSPGEGLSIFSRIVSILGLRRFGFSKGLSGHSNRRYAVNEAMEYSGISFVTKAFRLGWASKAIHTVFWYAEESLRGDRQCGRVLSGWTSLNARGQYGGGRPPALKALSGTVPLEKVAKFCQNLFVNYEGIEGANDPDLQEYLLASFLCRLNDYLSFLSEDPLNRFGKTPEENFEKSRLLQIVMAAASDR